MISQTATFQEHHPADRDAVAVGIALCWFFLLSGFILDMLRALTEGHSYVIAAHFHAASALGWMLLLSWQALKVRHGRLADHRRHGRLIGGWLAVVVSALATMWTADMARLAKPAFNPAGMAFQLGHVIPFVVFTAVALARTDRPGLHKRLMLLAMIAVLDTGWSRWVGHEFAQLLGDGWAGQLMRRYPASWIMLAAMAGYDWRTRGRLHPAFLPAAGLILVTQIGAALLFFTPGWGPLVRHALGG
ncbi:MAG: hypothetical protein JSS36_02615 [Proteobacteria bacterium]|nr:hypothetical protein [Pseudomonadota bacterium]